MQTLEQRCQSLEGELHPLHESKRALEATKNSLLAENAALKNEVQFSIINSFGALIGSLVSGVSLEY